MLEADTCAALIKTLQRDTRVLESFKIMDYSLLVGIHNLDVAAKEKIVSIIGFNLEFRIGFLRFTIIITGFSGIQNS